MAWQLFGTLAGGNQPASLFDTLSGQIANCVIIPCACGGSANNLTLTAASTPSTPPSISAYANFMCFAFVAASTSTGNVQASALGQATLPVYAAGGASQAGSGALVAGTLYIIAYQSSLNSNNGGFVIVSAGASSLTVPVPVSQGGTSLTSLTAFAVLCGGTSGTGAVQPIASVGNSGQVLTSNGAGALPTMQTISSAMTLLATLTANNSATLDDTTHITATYDLYMFEFENVLPATNATALLMRVSTNGGSSYLATTYNGLTESMVALATDNSQTTAVSMTYSSLTTSAIANSAGYGVSGFAYLYSPNGTTSRKQITAFTSYKNSVSTNSDGNFTIGYQDSGNTAINAVRFLMASGNITSGNIRIYGIKTS